MIVLASILLGLFGIILLAIGLLLLLACAMPVYGGGSAGGLGAAIGGLIIIACGIAALFGAGVIL